MVHISDEYGTDECSDMILGYWKPRGEFCDERKAKIHSVMERCNLSTYGIGFLLSAKSLGSARRKVLLNLLA